MKMTGGDIAVRALEDEGIEFTFGIPGTHNIELYDSLARSSRVRPVLVTDEQSASFMADGFARSSGKLAAVNLVPGAGLTHALSGIAEAFLDGVPMLVLSCGLRMHTTKGYQLHDVDQMAIARPVTKAQLRPESGSEIYASIRRACTLARTPPFGPVMVEVPVDHYLSRHDPAFDAPSGPPEPLRVPRPEQLDELRALLATSRRPLLYLGAGAAEAGRDLVALAERLEAPVTTSIQGKGVFPEDHPLWLWCGFGEAAPPFVQKIASGCDLTIAIGCRFSEVGTAGYGVEPAGPLVHVDIDPAVLGRNFPAKLPIVSDAAAFVSALLPHLTPRGPDPGLREAIRAGHAEVWKEWTEQDTGRVAPPHLLKTLQTVLGPEAVYTTDSGNGTFLAMECLRLPKQQSFLAPVDYSCMGYSLPSALGAALACPGRPVVALPGDGAFLMTGLELLTAAQNQLPVMVFVLRDRELAQIAQFQQTVLDRKTCSELPGYDLAALCQGVGVECLALENNSQVESVVRKALAVAQSHRPVVVDVAIDYSEKTYFTRGVVKVMASRLPLADRVRFIARALGRKLT